MKKIMFLMTSEKSVTGMDMALEIKEQDLSICLIQNAVFFAVKTNEKIKKMLEQNVKVFALKDDVNIRGIDNLIDDRIQMIDYNGLLNVIDTSETVFNC